MCQGYIYDLACGHQLTHFSSRCPANCAIPQGFRKPLHDTCGPCTPSFQNTSIARKYDELRLERMAAYRAAQGAGDREGEDKAIAQVAEDSRTRTAELAKVADLRRKLGVGGGERVLFPARDGWQEMKGGEDAPDDLFRCLIE